MSRIVERKQDRPDTDEPTVDVLDGEFMARLRSTIPPEQEIRLARENFGDDLPDDVIEELARQKALAAPILEQYHLFSEQTPTMALARATMMGEIDNIMDTVAGMDLSDLGDVGEFPDEYTCPRCAHRWSGAPNFRTGYGDKVYVPTGRISPRTGKLTLDRYGPPSRTVRNFKFGRQWRGASAEKLPRGFGNRPIGQPIVGEDWRRRKKQA